MLGDERASSIRLWELFARIKRKLQRRNMRAEQNILNNRALHQLRLFLFHARIDIRSDVAVRPSIESAISHRSEIIRWQIVPKVVPLIHRGPEFFSLRI